MSYLLCCIVLSPVIMGCGVSLVGAERGRRQFGTSPAMATVCRAVAGGSQMIPIWLCLEAFDVLACLERIVTGEGGVGVKGTENIPSTRKVMASVFFAVIELY
ncbi:hypothetical protein Trydic_g7566 [Trypoxylus dichotomus]